MTINLNNFDWKFYLYVNKDLYKAGIDTKLKAENHLRNYGLKENRIYEYDRSIIDDFDSEIYMIFNKDLIENNPYFKPLYHWLAYGIKENRIYNIDSAKKSIPNFNWIKYLYINKDLIYQNIDNEKKAIFHYLKHGLLEKREYSTDMNIPEIFNWEDYKLKKDLNEINNYNDAFIHFIENTDKEFIHPNAFKNVKNRFDTDHYISMYNIIDKNKNKIIDDWINRGRYEKRIFFNKFNKNKINSDFGIAVTIYSDEYTPIERIEATYIFLNSLVLNYIDNFILILIDNKIDNNLLKFIKQLKKYYKNINVFINKKNYGISISKNICLKLLNSIDYLSYYCLLDDDIEIIKNFENYSKNILNKTKIPILSNFNKEFSYQEKFVNNIKLIKTKHYLGNLLILKKNMLEKYGYFNKFTAKWGDEHLEITKRYLKNTDFRNRACDFREYIIDSIKIGNINTLHLHSCKVNQEDYLINKKEHKRYLKKIKYVDFKFNFNQIKSI